MTGTKPRQRPHSASRPGPRRAALLLVILGFALLLVAGVTPAALAPAPAQAYPSTVINLDAVATSSHFLVRAEHQSVADRTLKKAERAWAALVPHFAPPSQVVTIAVLEDPKAYEAIAPAPMTRGFSTFGGTHIYLLGNQLDQEVVTHELTHIFLGLNSKPGLAIPDWFNEGLAQYASGAQTDAMTLMYYASAGDLLALPQLTQVDALQGSNRQMATVEGLAVVRFLVDAYGEPRLWSLVGRLATASSFNQAMQDTYGKTDLQLDAQWKAYASRTYSVLSPAMLRSAGVLALALVATLASLFWFVRRMRRLSRAEGPTLTLAEIEAADRAERDLGDDVDTPPGDS